MILAERSEVLVGIRSGTGRKAPPDARRDQFCLAAEIVRGNIQKQRIALDGKGRRAVKDALEKMPAEKLAAKALLGLGMFTRHEFETAVEIAEARRAPGETRDLFMDCLWQDQA